MTELFRVVTTFTGAQGSPWMNVLHFDATSPLTAQDAADAAATFWGACDALMDNAVSWLTEPVVVEFDDADGTPTGFHNVAGGSGTGAVADLSLPFAVQALIRLFTGSVVNGHQVRGRIFVPGITRNNLAEGVLNSAAITAFDTAADNLFGDADSILRIWARPVDAEHATENSPERPGTSHVVNSTSTASQFAVLRRRRD